MTWKESVSNLHAALGDGWPLRKRLEKVSSHLIGTPYCRDPLGGSPGEIDPPAFSFHCLDCVTYVETALAVALSHTVDEYVQQLIRLRYRNSTLFWSDRLHYFSLWLESNHEKGMLEILVPRGERIREKKRLLTVAGLPIIPRMIEAHPWDAESVDNRACIIGFVSQRPDLDVFHVGLVADRGRLLRHASASAGKVIEEPLARFLRREDGSGFIMAQLREIKEKNA